MRGCLSLMLTTFNGLLIYTNYIEYFWDITDRVAMKGQTHANMNLSKQTIIKGIYAKNDPLSLYCNINNLEAV